jgi:phosphate transport system substrate-binding protein
MNSKPVNVVTLVTCRKCGYDSNETNATYCEVCDFPLRTGLNRAIAQRSRLVDFSSLFWLGLLLSPLLLLGGGYWLWQTQVTVLNAANVDQQPPRIQTYSRLNDVPHVPKGLFNYGGALPFAALAAYGMNTAIAQAYPGFQLRYTEPLNNKPTTSTGIQMLIGGELSFAQTSRPLNEKESSQALRRGFRLEQVPVAIDGIVFYTHPGLDVVGLSIDQIQKMYRGELHNWNQVGGPDLPIVLVSLDPNLSAPLQLLLGDQNQQLSSKIQVVRDYTASIRKVASTLGAISYASAPNVVGQRTVHLLSLAKAGSQNFTSPTDAVGQINAEAFRRGTYPFTRRLFIAIRRDGTPDERAGIAYANLLLSDEGQQIIQKAGFVSIYTIANSP